MFVNKCEGHDCHVIVIRLFSNYTCMSDTPIGRTTSIVGLHANLYIPYKPNDETHIQIKSDQIAK